MHVNTSELDVSCARNQLSIMAFDIWLNQTVYKIQEILFPEEGINQMLDLRKHETWDL